MHFLDCSKQPSNVNLVLRELFRDGYTGLPTSSSNFQVYERIGRSFHANYRSHQKWDSLLALTYKSYVTYELTKMFIPTCTKKNPLMWVCCIFCLAMLATFNHAWTTEESIILFIFKRAKNKRSQSDIPIFILRVVFFLHM